MVSAVITDASVTAHDEFHCRLHVIDLNCASGAVFIAMKAVVIHNKRFLTPYIYELFCTLLDEVPEALEDVTKYGLYTLNSQPIKVNGNRSSESL